MAGMKKNWKTTLFGLLSAAAGFIAFSPGLFAKWPWLVDLAKYVMVGGLGGLGMVGTDSGNHPTIQQVEIATVEKVVEDAKKQAE